MWKKGITLSLMSALLLAGCNVDDENDALGNPMNNNDAYENGTMDRNNNGNGTMDRNNDMFNNDGNGTLDRNNETDKDTMRDENTPQEEIIEDDMDARDNDTKDE